MVTLHGQGKDNVLGTVVLPKGATAQDLLRLVEDLVSQPASEINLLNLDNPMFLVGGMLINRDMRVAVQPQAFRNAQGFRRGG